MKTGKIIKKILKFIFLALLVLVLGLLTLRMCSSTVPASMKKLIWNDRLTAAYQSDPEGFSVEQQISRELVTADGSFFACNIIYIESAQQLQLRIRYTDYMMKELEAEIGADTLKEEPFEFRLLAYVKEQDTDTGSTAVQNKKTETQEFTDYTYTTERKSMYNYRRLVYDDIDLELYDNIIMQVYLNKVTPETEPEPYKELTVRRGTFTWKAYSYEADLPRELREQ